MARKWQNLAAIRRKSIALPRTSDVSHSDIANVDKGFFVVYTSDGIRFVIPLNFLKNDIFKELLDMAENEYGLQNDGPIRLPINGTFMQYTMSIIKSHMRKDVEKGLRMVVTSWQCLPNSNRHFERFQTQLLVC
uniref:auxin-responsive protein SAUR68-like n=1 Tax=Erigeron canadensis TaxID=72917 RepID=UPI001CB8C3FC|nr:auxin-responsive protein SAUR68-like [Erigeron canadensis]